MSQKLDKLDLDILRVLQQDGRMPNTKIGAKLGIGEKVVRKRMSSMIKRDIARLVPWVDYGGLGYQVDAIITIQADPTKVEEIAIEVARLPGVHYACVASGEYDIFILVCFKSNSEILGFLRDNIAPIEGVVRTRTHVILHVVQPFLGWVPLLEKEL